ncbi:MAG TPA: peptidoglycan-binding protein [Acidimicrobiales bacterium]|nr:peptidoglycan-binding protein [Acidimicrobiales bacterium]
MPPVLLAGDVGSVQRLIVGLHASAGNAAVGQLVARATRVRTAAAGPMHVQRCGPTPCACSADERAEHALAAGTCGAMDGAANPWVQRQQKGDTQLDVCVTVPVIGEVCGQGAAEACKKSPVPLPGCSAVCKVFDCSKPKEPKTSCPPGWRASTSKAFEGQCCLGPIDMATACCTPDRISLLDFRCCRPGEVLAEGHCRKSGELPPVEVCPDRQKNLLGQCCFPPQVPSGIICITPDKPPGPTPGPPPVPPPPVPAPCVAGPIPHPLTALGSSGIAVSELQCKLTKANVGLLPLSVDSIFGPRTKGGVAAFQARKGLDVDGKAGPETWKKLDEATGTAPGTHPTLVKGNVSKPVAELQEKLNSVGIQPLPLPTNGRFTELEEGAVVGFQDGNGLGVDGKAGPKTWAAVDAATGGP